MVKVHEALIRCLKKIVGIIEFEKARYLLDENGRFVIPDKESYVNIQF